jgi:hypothetical protein
MLTVKRYNRNTELPPMPTTAQCYFASFFKAYAATPGFSPYLWTAEDEQGRYAGSLFAITQRCFRWFPPFLFHRAFVITEGHYAESGYRHEDVFKLLLDTATPFLLHKCLMIEFKRIRNGRFGYKYFRDQKYIPIHWLEVHNSLHSRAPEERVFERVYQRIERSERQGVMVEDAVDDKDINEGVSLLRHYYASKLRRYCPPPVFFVSLLEKQGAEKTAELIVVKFNEHIIGASFIIFGGGDAHLLYWGGLRKTYHQYFPGIMAVWGAIKSADRHHCAHLRFSDAGLPFRTNPYRDFILSFGGTQQSTRRWFRFRWAWLNKILSLIYV